MKRSNNQRTAPLLTALALASPLASAQQLLNETHIFEAVNQSHNFGYTIGVSNGLLAVGDQSLGELDTPQAAGGVHLYDIDSGFYIRTLVPSSSTPFSRAGLEVAIDGQTIVINDRGASDSISYEHASVFVFDALAGQRFEVVADPDDQSNGYFGLSIDVGDGAVAIGSPLATLDVATGFEIGKVYLIDEMTGTRLGTIETTEAPEFFGFFGTAVDIHNGKVAVSAHQFNSGVLFGGNTERVEIFDLATQQHLRTIYSPAAPIDQAGFGYDIAMNDHYLVVAAPWQDDTGENSGAVHVYDIDTGDLISTLDLGAAPMPGNVIMSISVRVDINDEGLILVRRSGGPAGLTNKAAVYEASSGVELAVLEPSFGHLHNDASDVALSGGSAFVGAPRFLTGAPGVSAYSVVFQYDSNASIALHPQGLVVEDDSVDYSMQVVATGATGYQWYLDGVAISDLDPNYTGSTESVLWINSGPDVEGVYTVEVFDEPFSILSEEAYYIYRGVSTSACQADFNNDGVLNFFDISMFIQAFSVGCP